MRSIFAFSKALYSFLCVMLMSACTLPKSSSALKSQLILGGTWTLARGHCDNSKVIVIRHAPQSNHFNERFDLVYEFINDQSGRFSIVRDIWASPLSGLSPYLSVVNFPFASRTLITSFETKVVYWNNSVGQRFVKVQLSGPAECKNESGVVFNCPASTDDPDYRSRFEFEGIATLDQDILTVNGKFSPSLMNCSDLHLHPTSPFKVEFVR